MQEKKNRKRWIITGLMLLFVIAMSACGEPAAEDASKQEAPVIVITGDGIDGEIGFTLDQMKELPKAEFEHVYSTVNNWPAAGFYAARGITVESILKAAGVLDSVQAVTFQSEDSYEATFTREQLLNMPQYYFPEVDRENDAGAEEVKPIIAYEWKKDSRDLGEVATGDLCLILGQTNPREHTNPVFVENVSKIIVSAEEPQRWEPASTFPAAGLIAAGETVKLQHSSLGQVKLFYTLDGSDPTPLSFMYNPSTYQPELNKPIPITETTTIKVMAIGFGKLNSKIATYEFIVE